MLLSILDYSEYVDVLIERFSEIERSIAGISELNGEVFVSLSECGSDK